MSTRDKYKLPKLFENSLLTAERSSYRLIAFKLIKGIMQSIAGGTLTVLLAD